MGGIKVVTQNVKNDFNQIIERGKIISTKESLRDITPIPWSEEVLEGDRKVVVSKMGRCIQKLS